MRRPAILALIWFVASWKFISAFLALPPLNHRLDFANYYDSALALRQGLDPYTMNLSALGDRLGLETGPLIHAADTPTFLLCFEPLTLLPPVTAFWIWISLNLVALAMAIGLLLVRRPCLDASTACLLGALTLGFYPIGWNFYWAQTQVLTLALMVSAMRAMENERDAIAGLMIALAGVLRVFPFLLLGYLVLRRNWRALEYAIGGTIAAVFLTVAFLGFAVCFSFLDGVAWVSNQDRMTFPFVISLAPFVWRMFWALFGPAPDAAGYRFLCGAIFVAYAIVLAAMVRASLVGVSRRDDDFRIYSLWIVASVLLSPIAWHHYLVLLVIPFAQITIAFVQNRASHRALWMAGASYLLTSVSVSISFRLLADPTAFQRAFPSLSAPLLETGFFSLLMGFIAAYWFCIDLGGGAEAARLS